MFSVGVCDLFSLKKNYLTPSKLSAIRYGAQAITVSYCAERDIFFTGMDDGLVCSYTLQRANHPFYKEYFSLKVHEKRVMGLAYDQNNHRLYTIGEDGFLKVIDHVKKQVITSV
jgi:hypothetical protein